jgi:hypothetical protein
MGGDQINNAEDKSSERQKRGNLPSPSGGVWSAVATAALGWGPRGGAPPQQHQACVMAGGGSPPRPQQHQANPGWGGAPDDQRSNTKGGRYPPQRHSRTLSEVGGCSTGKSFRFVRACVRAVWLSSGIGYQKMLSALFPFPFLARRAFLFLFWAQGAFPFTLPPPPKTAKQRLLGVSVKIWDF